MNNVVRWVGEGGIMSPSPSRIGLIIEKQQFSGTAGTTILLLVFLNSYLCCGTTIYQLK